MRPLCAFKPLLLKLRINFNLLAVKVFHARPQIACGHCARVCVWVFADKRCALYVCRYSIYVWAWNRLSKKKNKQNFVVSLFFFLTTQKLIRGKHKTHSNSHAFILTLTLTLASTHNSYSKCETCRNLLALQSQFASRASPYKAATPTQVCAEAAADVVTVQGCTSSGLEPPQPWWQLPAMKSSSLVKGGGGGNPH